MALPLDRYLRHDELTEALHDLASRHPDLVTVDSVGRSYEGRELWLVTVTDRATGPHHEKPAHWIDANIHAVEITAGVAALAVLEHLTTGYGTDAKVTRAVRERTFYVVPRVNPDGVELVLSGHPRIIRSSVRRWPWATDAVPGLVVGDVDGDGRVALMRVPDPHGGWRVHPDDERLMARRAPDDGPDGGPFYRLLGEGTVADYDGFTIPTPRAPEGLDLNRNYPSGWATSVTGSGDFPGSEPETRSMVRAITDRPNICGCNAFHTMGGVLLRPSSTGPDSGLPAIDLFAFGELGRRATELTGFPVHSVYESFTWDRTRVMAGASDDWAYEHRGVYAWTTELWDVLALATGMRMPPDFWVRGATPDQELAVARWYDEHAPGAALVAWRPFDHPQLGPVEIGGWDAVIGWANPPPAQLPAAVAGHGEFAVFQALASPRLEVVQTGAEPLGDDLWRVTAGLANTGWLPTDVTARARAARLALPLVGELQGAEVVGGPARLELGQLEGRIRLSLQSEQPNDGTGDRVLASWLVRAPAGTTVTVEARHQRAGVARASVPLVR
jgi:hypothetical protein